MPKQFFLGANWKMNPPPSGWSEPKSPYRSSGNPEIVVFPTFLDLERCGKEGIVTGAQCGRQEVGGAFTGDVSMAMLQESSATHVLCGHSERRKFHGEMDAGIAKQVVAALDAELIPILCIGETKEEREKGETKERLQQQLSILLSGNSQFSILNSQFILAYEPVWAISGGNGSSEAMAAKESQEMHSYIRSLLPDSLKKTRILYGGSMNAKNAKEILSEPDIDGGLIGNASLHPEEFGRIVEISREI